MSVDLTKTPTAELILARLLLVPSNKCLIQDDMENDLSLGEDEIIPFITDVFQALSEADLIDRQVYDGDLRVRGQGPAKYGRYTS
jgi:hypothetical protein